MLEASCMNINEASRMESVIDQFVCQLCKFVVAPDGLECKRCNMLFCEECQKLQLRWQCPVRNCGSKERPVKIHRSVQEILEMLQFTCPGCENMRPLRYKAIFDHVKQCDKISNEMKVSKQDMVNQIVANVPAAQQIPHLYSSMSNTIYVFDKDSKQVLMYNRTNGQVLKAQIDYRQTEGNFQVSLPHNFQVVQVGKQPHVYMIGGGDYN